MLAAAIIVFREVIEAGLIVGIVLAVTKGVPSRSMWIAAGAAAGVMGACLLALFAGTLSAALAGMGQELFSAGILAIAVVMLTWHNVWMARHGRELAAEIRAAGEAVVAGSRPLAALAVVVGVAVLREGSEVVLFLYGVLLSEKGNAWSLFAGGVLGLALGCVLSALTYAGLLKIPGRYIFGVTSVLIAFLAAGMAAQCVAFLEQADLVTALSGALWDSSAVLPEKSLLGRVLHSLVGYAERPSYMQGLVYAAVLSAIFILMRVFSPARAGAPKPADGAASRRQARA